MADETKKEADVFIEDDGISAAKRAESAAGGQANNQWMLAALITTNGGGILTLLNQPARGWAVGVALALYLLGVTAALFAGRQAANLAYETESLFISLMAETRATRALAKVARTGNPTQWQMMSTYADERSAEARKAGADFEKIPTPDKALGFGVIFFFLASVFAGIGVF